MNLLIWLTMLCSFAADAEPDRFPDELASLREVADDEDRLVEAVRQFHLQQLKLAAWDLELAGQHKKTDDAGLAEAKEEQVKHRLAAVRQAYEFTLRRYPNNARAHTYYGELLYDHCGEAAGAIRAWKLATALDPELSAPYNDLAIHYAHVGDYALALGCYDKAIALEPHNSDYAYNLAQMYLINFPQVQKLREWSKARIYREAMKLSRKAARLAPDDFELVQDYAVNFFAAERFGVEANWRKAAQAWLDARELTRNDVELFYTWLNEARVWIRTGSRRKAVACLEEALRLQPDSQVTRDLLREQQGVAPAEQ